MKLKILLILATTCIFASAELCEKVPKVELIKYKESLSGDELNLIFENIKHSSDKCLKRATELQSLGGDINSCVSVLKSDLDAISFGIWQNIIQCLKRIFDALKSLGSSITGSGTGIVETVLKLKELIFTCYNEQGQWKQMICITSNVRQFTSYIVNIINNAKEIINILKEDGKILIEAVKSCSLTQAQFALDEIEKINTALDKCKYLH